MSFASSFLSFALLLTAGFAAPQPEPEPQGLVGGVVDGLVGDLPLVEGVLEDLADTLSAASALVLRPSSVAEASSRISSVIEAQATSNTIIEVAADLVEAGLTPSNVPDAFNFVQGVLTGQNSDNNNNPRDPSPAAFPKARRNDAPYSLTEQQLRAAIYIPPTFQYGRRGAPQPAILVPGTGDTGYTTFIGSYIPLLQGSNIADPVWLNIPDFLLDDAQVNAEYVAYAVNYIYGISNHRKVAVVTWSQGGIDAQWAFKYWPSTRSRVTDLVAFSPDFHGTILADLIDAGEPLPPSVLQQEYNSNFITTLRANGGDSAYVPTTTVYSGFFDEIVEPQQGRGASAFLNDARGKGVTNNEVQKVCPNGSPGGSFYTHEGTLYNPLGFALLVDALSHKGPGRPSRLNLKQVCWNYLTPGLDLTDFLLTENSILIAGAAILATPNKVLDEPPIKRGSSPFDGESAGYAR
ncbi:uncharacterized protein LTR77_008580 [Saxophila tyrrhenica]|uniref:Lipase B n=1 Tax=Saxophila tyrrhenica TaxID=1690608 RepID=A0AAV9P3B1_9PEZI|nr:hypothetical protein LTR77_008580 [Saxophila tyrrhenica]